MYICRFFLPPIILYAGLSVRKKAFFRNLPTIASLGILGTYIAFAVIAFTLFGFSHLLKITLAVSPTTLVARTLPRHLMASVHARDNSSPAMCSSQACI